MSIRVHPNSWLCLLLLAWLLLLAATVALSVLAAQHDTLPGDQRIMDWAQDRAFPGRRLSDAVRAITTTQVVLIAGVAAAVALWLLGHRWEAVLLLAGLAVLPLLQSGVKDLVDRPRPSEPAVDLRGTFTSPSFPSGHVMSPSYLYGFGLYLALRSGLPRALRVPLGAWSAFALLFAGPPNVWLGVHWPSDVLGGWAWALVILLPLVAALEWLRAPPRR